MDARSRALLGELYPPLAALLVQLLDQFAARGQVVRVTQGYRSYEQQATLYAQGRSTPGPIVTRAPPGHSWHEFKLAADVAPFDLHGKPDWNLAHPVWQEIVAAGEALGLFSGTEFVHAPCDTPHFQLTGSFPASPTDAVRALYASGGYAAVFNAAFE